MANFNKVVLMGNITKDPQLRYTPGGTAVTTISMAINRVFGSKDGEEKKQEVCFVDLQCWARMAENICKFVKKGSPEHTEVERQVVEEKKQAAQHIMESDAFILICSNKTKNLIN